MSALDFDSDILAIIEDAAKFCNVDVEYMIEVCATAYLAQDIAEKVVRKTDKWIGFRNRSGEPLKGRDLFMRFYRRALKREREFYKLQWANEKRIRRAENRIQSEINYRERPSGHPRY